MKEDATNNATRLEVGFAKLELPLRPGVPLAGVISRQGRFCTTVRDPLFVRALHLATEGEELTLVCVDLLVITSELRARVAERVGAPASSLLLSATHTHSAPGGYWDAGRGRLFMGEFSGEFLDELVESIAAAVVQARAMLSRAVASGSVVLLGGVNANRRRHLGPVDRELSLVRFSPQEEAPIDLVSFGAHPVIVSERAPTMGSGDYPGELSRRIEARGGRTLFFQGPVGGVSPLFPEFPMALDEHLALVGGLLEGGYLEALSKLEPIRIESLETELPQLTIRPQCAIFPEDGLRWKLGDLAATPLRSWMLAMARDAQVGSTAELQVVRAGELALVGTPCDLGASVAIAMKACLRDAGVRVPLVGSHCNDYVGYVHLPEDYEHVPEPGFRAMAFYENAMSLSGRKIGGQMVEAVHRSADPLARLGLPAR